MSLESNPQYVAAVKQEYLPPPLENNYLSLFDIQAKMAQEFLQGSDQEKIATIKKRIKKFFDYGNDRPTDIDLTTDSYSNKRLYPPCEVKEDFNIGIKIFPSQIILYGKDKVSLQIAEQIFPGFIGSQKIDDCNIKLIFAKQEDSKKTLKKVSKDKGTITTDHIMNPCEIQWFEVELKPKNGKEQTLTFYVRYSTNKDDILFQNDQYFRKLLGRARHLIDKKEAEERKRGIEQKEKALKKARIEQRRIVAVKRFHEKSHSKDFDTITNYDGVYSERPYQNQENSREAYFNESFQAPQHNYSGQKSLKKSQHAFDDLNISEIQDKEFYDQKKYEYNPRKRNFHKSASRDHSIDFTPGMYKKRKPEEFFEDPRNQMIALHRGESASKHERKNRFSDHGLQDREFERKMTKSKGPRYH